MKKVFILFIVVVLSLSFAGCVSDLGSLDTLSSSTTSTATSQRDTAARRTTMSSRAATTTTKSSLTISQQNALRMAKSYLRSMAFSRKGLIEQLEYEGFSHADAVFAADNCEADWNEQAARTAKSYLRSMAFSRQGLIEQLEYEGFTHEQAVYGVTAVGY